MKTGNITATLFIVAALIFVLADQIAIGMMFICISMLFVDKKKSVQVPKFSSGTFFVRLESVPIDKSQKIELIKTIRDSTGINLREAKNYVDAVALGSMSIIIKNIDQSSANRIKQIIDGFNCKVSVVENKPML